jgi:phosphoribosyl 1,2-cyclic phosphate phosphodiesterase
VRLRILGCGTSSGVPRIGNDWGECDPAEPRNRRRRVSILVSEGETGILVDTGPDLREQLLDAGTARLDAVIWTHDHADHCHGIDDLRQIYHAQGSPVAGYARDETLQTLRSRFAYIFDGIGGYPPVAEAAVLPDTLDLGSVMVRVVDQPHGSISSAGLRFESGGRSIGYATDFSSLTDEMAELFQGLDVWVVDALRRRPHPTHPNVDDVLGWAGRLGPNRVVLTHMDHSMDYRTLRAQLPENVEPGYDGLEIAL